MKRLKYLLDSNHEWDSLKLLYKPVLEIVTPFNDGYVDYLLTLEATDITTNSANLRGEVSISPPGGACYCSFEYGKSPSLGSGVFVGYYQVKTSLQFEKVVDLSTYTVCYFRAHLLYGGDYYYGEILSFALGVRSYTVRQSDRRGRPIFLAECKAFNAITGALIDTQYTDNGIAVFTTLPTNAPVDVEVRWDKQFRLYQNVYEAGGDDIETMVAVAHARNTDDYTKGVQVTTEPASPAEGRWYVA